MRMYMKTLANTRTGTVPISNEICQTASIDLTTDLFELITDIALVSCFIISSNTQ